MSLVAGSVFAGRYRIGALLGAGGMGNVYRAEHTGLGKLVALKVMGSLSRENAARFEREAHAIARLDHAGCVRVLDYGADDRGIPYLAMELLGGQTLHAALAGDRFSVVRAVSIAQQLLAALAHAHAHGIIHRDIKPENIMLTGARAVLIDFGLAALRDAPALTGAGMAIGSPSYIAPERLRGEPYDARADLYAVGVVLYEMLAGLRPFIGARPEDIMTAALSRPPRPLRVLAPEIPAALDAAVRRALAKDPARRYADADEMRSALSDVTALAAALAAEPAEAEPSPSGTYARIPIARPSVWQRAWGWLRYGAWRWRDAERSLS